MKREISFISSIMKCMHWVSYLKGVMSIMIKRIREKHEKGKCSVLLSVMIKNRKKRKGKLFCMIL
jgi:hypothetical protein